MKKDENFIHNKFGYCYYAIPKEGAPIIFNLYVESEYRQQGHAKWLLHQVIKEIRKTPYYGKINVQISPGDESVNAERLSLLYQNFGLTVLV